MEFVIILINLIGSKNKVFVFEDPELHLHPSAQRSLSRLIESHYKDNQVIIVTHSPLFINRRDITQNSVVRYKDGQTLITQIKPVEKPENEEVFTEEEKYKLYKELSGIKKEIFFSRAVLLVEGDTELSAIPILADKLGKNLDISNVFVCSVDGKHSFEIYQKLLKNFQIPYAILCDKDALNLSNISKCENKVVLDSEFESFLESNESESLLKEAKKEVGQSKARIGRYVAEKIPKEKIPKEFIDIIDKVVNLSKNE